MKVDDLYKPTIWYIWAGNKLSLGSHKQGTVVDNRFELLRQLGRGGFGDVWQANDLANSRIVALKLLHTDLVDNSTILERFCLEATLLTKLVHPAIAHCIHSGQHADTAYMAMQLAPGENLHDLMIRRGRAQKILPVNFTLSVITQIGTALDFAHAKGVVHRDLKPKNIMINVMNDRVDAKLLDFGIAKVLYDTAKDATTVGRLLGSLLYLSPEQALSDTVSARADIFALATVTFEMLTQRRAWAWDINNNPLPNTGKAIRKDTQNNQMAIMKRIVSGPRPLVHRFHTSIPNATSEVLVKALSPDPTERYESAKEFVHELKLSLGEFSETEDQISENSLTHVVPRSSKNDAALEPVIPSEQDEKDLLPRTQNQRPLPTPLGLETSSSGSSPEYGAINVSSRKRPSSLLLLAAGLLLGVGGTVLTSRWLENHAPVKTSATSNIPQTKTITARKRQNESKSTEPVITKNDAKNPETTGSAKSSPKPNSRPSKKKRPRLLQSAKNTQRSILSSSSKVSLIQTAWNEFQLKPEDTEAMQRFSKSFQNELETVPAGKERTKLTRCLKLAEIQATLSGFRKCFEMYQARLK
ncbi:MAG: serine/threonine-protein kinase [Myxococcota bacterium]|nr:serine/threonine-protein kinase [Myxococcota bacterium]